MALDVILSYTSYDMSARINARLDDELATQLEDLRRLTGKSLTELVEAALRAYCNEKLKPASTPYEAFERTGFLGGHPGPRNLARNYKRELTRSLSRKYGLR